MTMFIIIYSITAIVISLQSHYYYRLKKYYAASFSIYINSTIE